MLLSIACTVSWPVTVADTSTIDATTSNLSLLVPISLLTRTPPMAKAPAPLPPATATESATAATFVEIKASFCALISADPAIMPLTLEIVALVCPVIILRESAPAPLIANAVPGPPAIATDAATEIARIFSCSLPSFVVASTVS